jgi:hypothetical protein
VYAGRSCRPLIGRGRGDIRGGLEGDWLHWVDTDEEIEWDGDATRHFSAAKGECGCLTDLRLEGVGEVGLLRWNGNGRALV